MPISFDEFQKRLTDELEVADKSSLQGVMIAVRNHFKYGVDNYDDLDEQGKAAVDKMFNAMKSFLTAQVSAMPDIPVKREVTRGLALLDGKHYTVEHLLQSLEKEPPIFVEFMRDGQEGCLKILQSTADVIFDSTRGKISGLPLSAILMLAMECFDNLLIAIFLVRHRCVNQAMNQIRTAHEALEKIRLFRIQPKWASLWAGNDHKKIWKELKPPEIRKKLGVQGRDEIYDWYSKLGAHTYFESVKSRSGKVVSKDGSDTPKIEIWVGGTMNQSSVLLTYGLLLHECGTLLAESAKSFESFLNQEEGEAMIRDTWEKQKNYLLKYLIPEGKKMGIDATEVESFLTKHKV